MPDAPMTMPSYTMLLAYAAVLSMASISTASASEMSLCLDTSTTLDAGGDVSDKQLKAAEAACAQLQKSGPDHEESVKINAAAATIGDEARRRASAHH